MHAVAQGKLLVVNFKPNNDGPDRIVSDNVVAARKWIAAWRLRTGRVTVTEVKAPGKGLSKAANQPDEHDGRGASHIVAPKHVQEARHWIAAWKQRSGFPKIQEVHVAHTHGPPTDATIVPYTSAVAKPSAPSAAAASAAAGPAAAAAPAKHAPSRVLVDGSLIFTAEQLRAPGASGGKPKRT